MGDLEHILHSVPCETSVERYIGRVNVERLNGTVLKDMALMRKEKLAEPDDIESVYEREYYVEHNSEEIFVGNDKGETMILKEQPYKGE